MTNVAKSAGSSFHVIVWLVIVASILMIVAAVIDIAFDLRWGFSSKDAVMAGAVLGIAILLKVVGSKIIEVFGGA